MFCEKCGREIPEDSIYCAYCGVKLPPEEKASDWEEAARLRELQEAYEDKKTGKPIYGSRNISHGADCIRPGAPKKKCRDCGRELPASTIGEYCALCETRRNREAEAQAEAAENRRLQQEEAKGLRDRYDVSDEFDWQVFQRNQSNDPRKPAPENPGRSPKKSLVNVKKPKTNWKKTLLIIIGVLIAVRVLSSVVAMIVYFVFSNIPSPEGIPEREVPAPEAPVLEAPAPIVSSDTARRIWIDDDGNVTILDNDGSEELF